MYYIGEFLLAFVLFYPVVAVGLGVLSDPEARNSELGRFISFSPEIIILALFMAFTYTVVFSGLHFKYVFAVCAAVSVSVCAVVLGQGYWMMFAGPAAAILLLWLMSKRVNSVRNILIDAFNFYVKALSPDDSPQESIDTIFSEGLAPEIKKRHLIPAGLKRKAKHAFDKLLAVMMAAAVVIFLGALSFGGLIMFAKITNKTWGM